MWLSSNRNDSASEHYVNRNLTMQSETGENNNCSANIALIMWHVRGLVSSAVFLSMHITAHNKWNTSTVHCCV